MFVTISLLLAAACLLPAAAKLTGQPRMQESAGHFGIPWPRYRLLTAAVPASSRRFPRWAPTGSRCATRSSSNDNPEH